MGQSTDAFARMSGTIANGAAVSDAFDISKLQMLCAAVLVPSAWTAADIGFEVSIDGVTWVSLHDDEGNRIKITGVVTNASRLYIAPAKSWALGAFPYVRIVSLNTSNGANINQGADRTVILVRLSS